MIFNKSYLEYCKELQEKYGKCPQPYYVKWSKGKYGIWKHKGNKRTGLYIHHIKENEINDLSKPSIAKEHMDLQEPDMLCYCNAIEHLILHLMICIEYPNRERCKNCISLLNRQALKETAAWDQMWFVVDELFRKIKNKEV